VTFYIFLQFIRKLYYKTIYFSRFLCYNKINKYCERRLK